MGAIWATIGTLIPWGKIPEATICRVKPKDLDHRNFISVVTELILTTIIAMLN